MFNELKWREWLFYLDCILEYYLQYEALNQSIKYCEDSWKEFSHVILLFPVVGIGSGVRIYVFNNQVSKGKKFWFTIC